MLQLMFYMLCPSRLVEGVPTLIKGLPEIVSCFKLAHRSEERGHTGLKSKCNY